MTTIRAVCPTCGEVTLPASAMEVQLCAQTQAASYSFACPACSEVVRRDADRRIVHILVSGGIKVRVWELPGELLEDKHGPTITWDDVLDFHDLLQTDTWFEGLVTSS